MLSAFRARILSCEPSKNGFATILDQTAFFPEGGGQTADTGTIADIRVTDVRIVDGEILHFTEKKTGEPGEEVACALDFDERFRKMQNHLGEHLLCGAIHRLYGFENVGFHLGDDYMTLDIDGVLSDEQLRLAQQMANEAVAADVPVLTYIPKRDELSKLEYRAKSEKLESAEQIRIVEAVGYDRCACCAPHLDRTGRVGMIKIVESIHYKGGMRLWALCGFDALADYHDRLEVIHTISTMLSAKPNEIASAVKARLDELSAARGQIGALRREILSLKLDAIPHSEKNICYFDPDLDTSALKDFVTGGAAKTSGIFAAFAGTDQEGYQFAAASHHVPLKEKALALRKDLGGKCGGSDILITGRLQANEADIRDFFAL